MFDYAFLFGTHGALSAAESWRTLIRNKYSPALKAAGEGFMFMSLEKELPEDFLIKLGGTHRIGQIIGEQNVPWQPKDILAALLPSAPKLKIGINQKTGLALKKLARDSGIRIQFISPRGNAKQLNAAQVIFNKLTRAPNAELIFVEEGGTHYMVRTSQIQDIASYEARDTARPARDAKVGMLPPKLAQMMLNIIPRFHSRQVQILDPFCGLGTILQEGYLRGYEMTGTDISDRMVAASEMNLRALTVAPAAVSVFQHDIRQPFGREYDYKFDAVVTEPYLGEPMSTPLPDQEVMERQKELGALYLDFFRNIKPTLRDEAYVVLALPAFASQGRGFGEARPAWRTYASGLFDEIEKLGYHLKHLVPRELRGRYQASERGTYIYARPEALVGREITLWHIRKPEGQHN